MTETLQRLLVGVAMDASGEPGTGSRRAIDMALRLAERTGASVTFLHSTFGDWDDPEAEDEAAAARRAAACAQSLSALVARAKASGTDARAVTVEERPGIEMVHRAARGEVDLVVVGKRDVDTARQGERRLGTTSVLLLQQSPVPVLLVQADHAQLPRRVLAATDLSPVGDRAVALAASLSATCGAELHVVHAWQQTMQVALAHTDEARRDEERRIDEDARARIRTVLRGARAELHVACTSPERAIGACVERLQPDLVVMGSVSRTGVPGLLVGNTAERMRTRLDTSLLVLKPEGFVPPALR